MSLNYVTIGSNDVPRARAFYDALIPAIGGTLEAEYMPHAVCYLLRDGGRIWVVTPFDDQPATPGNGMMIGLSCATR
ncbi:MAG: VOC family protein, partial [Pseudomonadota bacterium]